MFQRVGLLKIPSCVIQLVALLEQIIYLQCHAHRKLKDNMLEYYNDINNILQLCVKCQLEDIFITIVQTIDMVQDVFLSVTVPVSAITSQAHVNEIVKLDIVKVVIMNKYVIVDVLEMGGDQTEKNVTVKILVTK